MPPSVTPRLRLGERSGSRSELWPNGGLSWWYLRRSHPRTRSYVPVRPASWRSAWGDIGVLRDAGRQCRTSEPASRFRPDASRLAPRSRASVAHLEPLEPRSATCGRAPPLPTRAWRGLERRPCHAMSDADLVQFQDVQVIAATVAALRCRIGEKCVWLPRSQISGKLWCTGDRGKLLIPRWVARDLHLMKDDAGRLLRLPTAFVGRPE